MSFNRWIHSCNYYHNQGIAHWAGRHGGRANIFGCFVLNTEFIPCVIGWAEPLNRVCLAHTYSPWCLGFSVPDTVRNPLSEMVVGFASWPWECRGKVTKGTGLGVPKANIAFLTSLPGLRLAVLSLWTTEVPTPLSITGLPCLTYLDIPSTSPEPGEQSALLICCRTALTTLALKTLEAPELE